MIGTVHTTGIGVTFPLFDGGKRHGQITQARAKREQARLAHERVRLAVAREVRTALAELAGAHARVDALGESVHRADDVLQNERLRYEAGRSTLDFVLDAEATLLTNEALLSQARRSVSTAQLSLDLSLGRITLTSVPGP